MALASRVAGRCSGYSYLISKCTATHSISLQLGVIAQGIAARFARRQASSEQASKFAESYPIFGFLALQVLENEGVIQKSTKARL